MQVQWTILLVMYLLKTSLCHHKLNPDGDHKDHKVLQLLFRGLSIKMKSGKSTIADPNPTIYWKIPLFFLKHVLTCN